MTDCTHKTIFGRPACRFEPRYDKSPLEGRIEIRWGSSEQIQALTDANRKLTYVRDVCVKCGRTIERNS